MTNAAKFSKEDLIYTHLFILQEMASRKLDIIQRSGIDAEVITIAKQAGVTDKELEVLGLVKVEAKQATAIQTLILSKDKFKSLEQAVAWVSEHGFIVPGEKAVVVKPEIDETETSYRFRQRNPGDFIDGSFRTIDIADGVKAVIGRLKEDKEQADKTDASDLVTKLCPIDKADEEKRIVFGVVLEPDSVDSQGDTISKEEIEQAAHAWLAKFQDRGFMHRQIVNSKIEIFESYVAPADLTIGGHKVTKGTWLLMYHVIDDAVWNAIKSGELTGFSMGGYARRERVS